MSRDRDRRHLHAILDTADITNTEDVLRLAEQLAVIREDSDAVNLLARYVCLTEGRSLEYDDPLDVIDEASSDTLAFLDQEVTLRESLRRVRDFLVDEELQIRDSLDLPDDQMRKLLSLAGFNVDK